MLLSWYQSNAVLIKLEVFPFLLCFERTYVNWHYFFLKCLREFTIKPLTSSFLCGKVFNHKSNFFNTYSSRLPISSWVSFDSLWLSRNLTIYLNCQIYWHKVVHNILIILLLLVGTIVISHHSFQIVNLICSSLSRFFFLSSFFPKKRERSTLNRVPHHNSPLSFFSPARSLAWDMHPEHTCRLRSQTHTIFYMTSSTAVLGRCATMAEPSSIFLSQKFKWLIWQCL